jgi:hypothetical protein
MNSPSIMIIGLGDLGGRVLDSIIRWSNSNRIIVGARDHDAAHRRVNLALFSAQQVGFDPTISIETVDLHDIDRTAETIAGVNPGIIFNSATLQSWRIITELPPDIFKQLDEAQFGPWLPVHLTLMWKLMQAVRGSGVAAAVVNSAFPDATNAVLGKAGLAPTCGIGNVANVIPALRNSAAGQLGAAVRSVQIRMVAQHYVSHAIPRYGDSGEAPAHIQVLLDGQDVTTKIDRPALLRALTGPLKRMGGREGQTLTAASATLVLRAMTSDSGEVVHAPGPNGLPGGYPVRFNRLYPTVVLPNGLSLEDAIKINESGQRADGIESIGADGTVQFASRQMAIMKDMIGYYCESMPLSDCEMWAGELRSKYAIFATKHEISM